MEANVRLQTMPGELCGGTYTDFNHKKRMVTSHKPGGFAIHI